jgi:hypothetical protein
MKQYLKTIFLTFSLVIILFNDAYAYIDLGTGSFILQMLIASIVGALFTFKMWVRQVKRYFFKLLSFTGKTYPQSDELNKTSNKANSPDSSIMTGEKRGIEKKP